MMKLVFPSKIGVEKTYLLLSSRISLALSATQGTGVDLAVLARLELSRWRSTWRMELDSFSWRVSRSSRS